MSVEASDGVHTVTSQLHLKVKDVNNHAPEFRKSFYSFPVSESARPGATVGRVQAGDEDAGENARVTYTLTSQWGRSHFRLDETHGTITLQRRPSQKLSTKYLTSPVSMARKRSG